MLTRNPNRRHIPLGARQAAAVIHFLFPASPFDPKEPDEPFRAQQFAIKRAGFSWSVCSDAHFDGAERLRNVPVGSTVVYRGWMVTPAQYESFTNAIAHCGAAPLISAADYLACHYLPNWYPLIRDLTPETVVVPQDSDLSTEFGKLGWDAFFIKDYVKSLKTGPGAIARTPTEALAILNGMRAYRGEIEGGLCLRRVEDFEEQSETRYFVLRGRAHHPTNGEILKIVQSSVRCISSPFFSVDVARRRDGDLRIIEIGDGQVSDLVGWSPEAFAELWSSLR